MCVWKCTRKDACPAGWLTGEGGDSCQQQGEYYQLSTLGHAVAVVKKHTLNYE